MTQSFIITRTSDRYRHDDGRGPRPHPDAYESEITTYDWYLFKSVADALKKYPNKEFTKTEYGVRTNDGRIKECWRIDVPDLASLLRIDDGAIVVDTEHGHPSIEIYDNYRE